MAPPPRWRIGDLVFAVVVCALPVLVALVDYVATNRDEVTTVGRIVWACAFILVGVLACVLAVTRWRHLDLRRTAMVAAWLLFAFFHFHLLFDGEAGLIWGFGARRAWVQLLAWLAIALLGARLVWVAARVAEVCQFATIFLAVLVGLQALPLFDGDSSTASPAHRSDHQAQAFEGGTFEQRPNIYHFILDQYPRADSARQVLGFDNSPFLGELRSQGFWVGDEAFTSYPNTMTAIPSVLEMRYPFESSADIEVGVVEMTRSMLGEGRAIQELRAEGYDYIYASAGPENWSMCRGPLVDRCLLPESGGLIRSEAEEAFLRRTPLSMIFDSLAVYTRPVDVVEAIEELGLGPDPYLLLAHVWQPHEPLEYDAECGLRDPLLIQPTRETYADELRCLNGELLDVIARIRTLDPDAVIVLQGDHGMAFGVDLDATYDDLETEDLEQRFAVLDARMVPGGCDPPPRGPSFTVNTYPWLFACLRGEELQPVEPRAFWWNYDFDGELVEIEDLTAIGVRREGSSSEGESQGTLARRTISTGSVRPRSSTEPASCTATDVSSSRWSATALVARTSSGPAKATRRAATVTTGP